MARLGWSSSSARTLARFSLSFPAFLCIGAQSPGVGDDLLQWKV